MTGLFIAAFAAATVPAYVQRSARTLQAPAVSSSQPENVSDIATCARAPSASSSNALSYLVAAMAWCLTWKRGTKSNSNSSTCHGPSSSGGGISFVPSRSRQYHTQACDSSIRIVSMWLGTWGCQAPTRVPARVGAANVSNFTQIRIPAAFRRSRVDLAGCVPAAEPKPSPFGSGRVRFHSSKADK